jgi:hypothetical protein
MGQEVSGMLVGSLLARLLTSIYQSVIYFVALYGGYAAI